MPDPDYIDERPNPFVPNTMVTIYLAEEQGIDTDHAKYAVVCQAHSVLAAESNLKLARLSMKRPDNFCDECRELTRRN